MYYAEHNAKIISGWVKDGWEWGTPISREDYAKARQGEWNILLTPTKPVPKIWFPDLPGKRLLGLAAGGGQQIPILTAAGAQCTVMDYADSQLDAEEYIADREGYSVTVVKADMTQPFPFADACFDIIVHPVSNCYVEDVFHIWRECFRVLRNGGVLLAGMDNGLNFLFDDTHTAPLTVTRKLPFNPLRDPALYASALQSNDGFQFSHTVEEQIGGQLQAGFRLTDIYEDRDRTGVLQEYAPQYMATRAVKERYYGSI